MRIPAGNCSYGLTVTSESCPPQANSRARGKLAIPRKRKRPCAPSDDPAFHDIFRTLKASWYWSRDFPGRFKSRHKQETSRPSTRRGPVSRTPEQQEKRRFPPPQVVMVRCERDCGGWRLGRGLRAKERVAVGLFEPLALRSPARLYFSYGPMGGPRVGRGGREAGRRLAGQSECADVPFLARSLVGRSPPPRDGSRRSWPIAPPWTESLAPGVGVVSRDWPTG